MKPNSKRDFGSARILPFVPRTDFTFGIYPGGVVQNPGELAGGKPDCVEAVNRSLDQLQSNRSFVVRDYLRFTGQSLAGNDPLADLKSMRQASAITSYLKNGRKLDLVLSNWDATDNLENWLSFIDAAIECFGEHIHSLQICEEPNLFEYPGDGRFGDSVRLVIEGVKSAHKAIRRKALPIRVGFNAIPDMTYNDGFWRGLAKGVDDAFLNALDYVGLNLYIDVSEALVGTAEVAVKRTLQEFRNEMLAEAGIPITIPMHICESGWPTGPNRYYTRQADILESIVRTTCELRQSLNIDQFELFSLRDADTANPDMRHQFGIMRDDYMPKPAFETFQRLIRELAQPAVAWESITKG